MNLENSCFFSLATFLMKLLQCLPYYYTLNAFEKVIVSHCRRLTMNCTAESAKGEKERIEWKLSNYSSISGSPRVWLLWKFLFRYQFVCVCVRFFVLERNSDAFMFGLCTCPAQLHHRTLGCGTWLRFMHAPCVRCLNVSHSWSPFFHAQLNGKCKCLRNGHKQFACRILLCLSAAKCVTKSSRLHTKNTHTLFMQSIIDQIGLANGNAFFPENQTLARRQAILRWTYIKNVSRENKQTNWMTSTIIKFIRKPNFISNKPRVCLACGCL